MVINSSKNIIFFTFRFTQPPEDFLEWYEPYLEDEEVILRHRRWFLRHRLFLLRHRQGGDTINWHIEDESSIRRKFFCFFVFVLIHGLCWEILIILLVKLIQLLNHFFWSRWWIEIFLVLFPFNITNNRVALFIVPEEFFNFIDILAFDLLIICCESNVTFLG